MPDQTVDVGTAFGQDDAEFNILNTDRQLSALQTAASMLRNLPEQKSLVYFASGLRLNGVDNQAQLRATINAAIRANVSIYPVDARGLVAMAPLGDATQASPTGIGALTGQGSERTMSNFQRSQDTLYSLAKDTGGKALFDNNDLSLGIVQAAEAIRSYYIFGFSSTHTAQDGKFHRVKVTLTRPADAELAYRQGYFADKNVRQVHRRRQGASARGRVDAGEPGHRHPPRDGGELLPVEPRGVFRAGVGQDARQRAGVGATRRRAAHADRLHRRGQGRLRHHHPERPRQARRQA